MKDRLQGEIEEWADSRKTDHEGVARYLSTLGSNDVDAYGAPVLDHPTVLRGLVEPVEAHLVDTVVTDPGDGHWHFYKVVQMGPSEFFASHMTRRKV